MRLSFESTKKITRKGRWLAAVFLPLAFIRGMISLLALHDSPTLGSVLFVIYFTGLPAWPALHGLRLLRTARRYPSYYHALMQSAPRNLNAIAKYLGSSPETVRRELNRMARHRLLPSLGISSAGDIFFPGVTPDPTAGPKLQRVVCPACGAPGNVEQGGHGLCAYCRGPLSADG